MDGLVQRAKTFGSLVGLGESRFLLLEYFVENLIDYSSTRQGRYK